MKLHFAFALSDKGATIKIFCNYNEHFIQDECQPNLCMNSAVFQCYWTGERSAPGVIGHYPRDIADIAYSMVVVAWT